MILKALYDYYHRSGDLPPMGFEKKEICFIIVIKEDGSLVRIEDTREEKTPKSYIVPRGEIKTSGIKANLLWDNANYVLAIPKDESEKESKNAIERNEAFIQKCKQIAESFPDVAEFKAVCAFYQVGISQIESAENWDVVLKERTRNVSFRLEHSLNIVPMLQEVTTFLSSKGKSDAAMQYCLVTGEKGVPVKLTGKVSLGKDQANIVSFQENQGYDSYGKTKCYNAPISEEAESSFTTSLKTLLAKDSRNKFSLGDRTFLFWSSNTKKTSLEVEQCFYSLINNAKEDNPNENIAEVKQLFKSIWSGIAQTASEDRFYILGLAPNKARIAVVYWNECSLKEFAGRILRHFEDMGIVDTRKDGKPYMGIYSMLSAVTLGGKQSDVQPNLPEAVLKSIVQGIAYPFTLYTSCLRRIMAELGETTCFSITRMAIIKAYLNRLNNNNKKIEFMLDKENNNQGYLCGRLFAVLDKIQEDANGIHTMRERYMNAASTTPATVFGTLMNLSSHHAENLKSEGSKVIFEKMKQEIISKLPSDGFPAHFDLQDQGRFFIGYYQQRADLFSKKDNDNKQE